MKHFLLQSLLTVSLLMLLALPASADHPFWIHPHHPAKATVVHQSVFTTQSAFVPQTFFVPQATFVGAPVASFQSAFVPVSSFQSFYGTQSLPMFFLTNNANDPQSSFGGDASAVRNRSGGVQKPTDIGADAGKPGTVDSKTINTKLDDISARLKGIEKKLGIEDEKTRKTLEDLKETKKKLDAVIEAMENELKKPK